VFSVIEGVLTKIGSRVTLVGGVLPLRQGRRQALQANLPQVRGALAGVGPGIPLICLLPLRHVDAVTPVLTRHNNDARKRLRGRASPRKHEGAVPQSAKANRTARFAGCSPSSVSPARLCRQTTSARTTLAINSAVFEEFAFPTPFSEA
jgi:hypothetical protein